jgi:DNA-binding beta-propeller fold protein YncE
MKRKTVLRLLTATSLFTLSVGASFSQTVYIPEGSANSVSIVDVKSGSVVRRFTNVEAAHGLSVAKDKKILVAGSLSEISDEAVDDSKPATMSAEDHAAHHSSSKKQTGTPAGAGKSLLSFLNLETGDVLRRVEVPGAVHHVAVSPDERFAVATHPSSDGISIVDLSNFEFKTFVPTGGNPNYLVFGGEPGSVYVSNAGNGTISEVDLNRGIVRRNLLAGQSPEHMVADPSSRKLYAADSNVGQVFELALDTGNVQRAFDIGGEIHGLDLTEDRQRLIVSVTDEDKLASVDLVSGDVAPVSLSPAPYHLTTVKGTNRAFVSSRAEPIVWVVDLADLSIAEKISIKGEGHQMVSLR